MAIKLTILPHQTESIRASSKVFEDVYIRTNTDIYSNPIFNIYDEKLRNNIHKIQKGEDDFTSIPKAWRTAVSDGIFGFDIKMETGERVIIVTGCINVLVSRVSEAFIKDNSCIA